jgi:DNA-binding CsgD family transcriptional regulator
MNPQTLPNAESAPSSPTLDLGVEKASTAWRLSRRQSQILALSTEGLTTREIAERLGCRPKTVEVHVTGLLRKAGAERRSELVAKVVRLYT